MKYKRNKKSKTSLLILFFLIFLVVLTTLAVKYRKNIFSTYALDETFDESKSLTIGTENKIIRIKNGTTKNIAGVNYKWMLFRHTAHTCAKSGYQTFLFVYPENDNLKTDAPLVVRYHGGGAGFFDTSGVYQGSGWITQENEDVLLPYFKETGVARYVQHDVPNTRFLITSMCDHDYSSGNGTVSDPNNPNNPDESGNARTADGLTSNIKAIIYIVKSYPTTKFVIIGTSAGAYGAFNTALRMQEGTQISSQLSGVVLDSGVSDWDSWKILAENVDQLVDPCGAIQEYVRPRLGLYSKNGMSAPVAFKRSILSGKWNLPIYLIWDENDKYGCGHRTVTYTNISGNQQTEIGTEIIYRPFADLIEQYNPAGKSKVAKLCVVHNTVEECTIHAPTQKNLTDKYQITGSGNYSKNIANWIISLF